MHPRYQEWITHVFDHPATETQWYFDVDAPDFSAPDEDIADLIRETFIRSGSDLIRFSDAQVNQGIWYLADSAGSNHFFSLRDEETPIEKRVAGIESILDLYRNCFATRCTPTLSHVVEKGASRLNAICYMFWDVCPLGYLENSDSKSILENAVFSVLEQTIRISHAACIEGGLHGLGHLARRHEKRVGEIIETFLSETDLNPILRIYAESAKTGAIQ